MMVQAYEVEGSGGGVWLLLTPLEFEIIFARFLRGMEAQDLRDDEVVRVMRGLRWIDKIVQDGAASGKGAVPEVKDGVRSAEGQGDPSPDKLGQDDK